MERSTQGRTTLSAQITNRGITLVALVITIIVLVILVGVTLSVTLNSGLISNAKNAVASYNQAQREEEETLTMLEAATNTENTEDNVVETGLISFTINDAGETTRYEAERGMTWGSWIESHYNKDGFFDDGGLVRRRRHIGNVTDGRAITTSELIDPDEDYYVGIEWGFVNVDDERPPEDPDIPLPDVPDPDVPLEEPL